MDSIISERISNFSTSLDNFNAKSEKVIIKGEEYSLLCHRYVGSDTNHLVVLDKNGKLWLLIHPPGNLDYIFYKLNIDNKDWYVKSK
jgi:hypothetical protein